MAKMKTLPKALIVGAIIAAAGFGLSKVNFKSSEKPVEVAEATPVETTPDVPEYQPPQRTTPAEQAPPAPVVAAVQDTAQESGTGIASGQKSGTNWPMVQDIVGQCSRPDRPLHNVISDGGLDNAFKIYSDKNTQFGVIPEDTLAYQAKIDPKMMSRVVVVFPFFSVEMHLIASKGNQQIRTLADLEGKRVVEGPEGSGTWVTVQRIKQLTGIKWIPVYMSQTDGLNAVKNGQVDAEFIVAGQPITVLKSQTDIKLIPLSHPGLDADKYYTRTMLPTGAYPFLGQAVSTYKLNNVLATFAYKNQYQKEIGDLVSCITRNMGELQTDGHPKWRDVDPLDIERVKWPVHPSALATIKREARAR